MIERLEVLSSHTPRHKPLYNSHRPLTREDFRRQRKVILEEIQSGLFLLYWYLWWLAEEERNKGRVCFQGKREKMNGNCNGRGGIGCVESEYIRRHHTHDDLADHQCSSALVKHIKAPVQLVKFLTFFPFNYSMFVYTCCMCVFPSWILFSGLSFCCSMVRFQVCFVCEDSASLDFLIGPDLCFMFLFLF